MQVYYLIGIYPKRDSGNFTLDSKHLGFCNLCHSSRSPNPATLVSKIDLVRKHYWGPLSNTLLPYIPSQSLGTSGLVLRRSLIWLMYPISCMNVRQWWSLMHQLLTRATYRPLPHYHTGCFPQFSQDCVRPSCWWTSYNNLETVNFLKNISLSMNFPLVSILVFWTYYSIRILSVALTKYTDRLSGCTYL